MKRLWQWLFGKPYKHDPALAAKFAEEKPKRKFRVVDFGHRDYYVLQTS
jgi:hypothetical protein